MTPARKKVVVAVSDGVDSAVAAARGGRLVLQISGKSRIEVVRDTNAGER
jgi:hypothetical protein